MTIATKYRLVSVEEFVKYDNMSSSHTYDEMVELIYEVRYHPNLWHDFGDPKELALEWSEVEAVLNDYGWPIQEGSIRLTWNCLYAKYMFDRKDECPFEDEMDFLWEIRAVNYWIWDDEECTYKRPAAIEDAPTTSWSLPNSQRCRHCYPVAKENLTASACRDCNLFHGVLSESEFHMNQDGFYPEDMDHDCFNTITCVTSRRLNAYFCYIHKNWKQLNCEAKTRVVNYIWRRKDGKITSTVPSAVKFISSGSILPEDYFSKEELVQAEDSERRLTIQESEFAAPLDVSQASEAPEDPALQYSDFPKEPVLEQKNAPAAAAQPNQNKWKNTWELALLAGLVINLIIMLFF